MNPFTVIATLLTAAGASLMVLSIHRTRQVLALLSGPPAVKRWHLMQAMLLLFLAGYLGAIPLLANGPSRLLPLLVGAIFFGLSIFVSLTITISLQTISALLDKEEALVTARNAALEAARLKTGLLNSVGHELRTPLQAVVGYLDMLLKGVYGTLTPEQDATVRRVRLNARRLSLQINNLLAQSAIESGKQVAVTTAPFAPAELLETVESTLYPLADRKQLTLRCRVEKDVPAILDGDMEKLVDIALNLTSNAIKFTEEGSVDVNILRPDSAHWALRVVDTGPGIPEESKQAILKPFQGANNSATSAREGIGLGLALVHKWTSLMGGELDLESAREQGTTITVRFPLNGEEAHL